MWQQLTIACLLVVVGSWMAFDGFRAMLMGDYVTPQTGRYAGQLGPWAALLRAVRVDPLSWPVKAAHIAVGLLGMIAAAFLRHAVAYYRRGDQLTSSVDAVRAALGFLVRLYAALPVDQFGPRRLKAVRQTMIDAGLARRTCNQQIGRIRSVFRWAAEDELIAPAIYHGLLALRPLRKNRGGRETPRVRPISWPKVAPLARFVSAQVWTMIQLQWFSGMRPGEVVQIRTADLDTTGSIWEYRPAEFKTDHIEDAPARVVALGPRAQEIIRPWLRTDLAAPLFQPIEAEQHRRGELIAEREARVGVSIPLAWARPVKKPS